MNCNCTHSEGTGVFARFVSVLLIALVTASVSASAQLSFLPAVTYDSGGLFPRAVAVADLNGDGKPDLVVANLCSTGTNCEFPIPNGTVGVLLGNGDGTFQVVVGYSPGGTLAQAVAVADVNGDGKPDLLVAVRVSNIGDGAAGVLLGNGDGTF